MWRLRIVSLSVTVSMIFGTAALARQNLRDLARQQAVRNPGVPLEQPAPPADYRPKTIEELTREADVVLVGQLVRLKSYLGPSEDRILTDYTVLGAKVLGGRLSRMTQPAPGAIPSLTVTVYGGEATVEGVLVRGTDTNRDPIKDGAQYVVFLKESRSAQAGRYEIYYGGISKWLESGSGRSSNTRATCSTAP